LVSVVIPAWNCEAFVGDAVESVLEQTYSPLECVVVDDGSIDGTSTIVRGFGSRIKYVGQARRCSGAARNAGAQIAGGEFLAFLDADDMWQPTKLERQMELALARPELGLVYCSKEIVDEHGRHIRFARAPDPAVVTRHTLLNQPPWVGLNQTGLVPRWAFEAVSGYDERLTTCEDGDLTWRLAARFPIGALPEPLAKYRLHPAQKHRDVPQLKRDWKLVLDKAFASGLLPPEVQALERQARANLTLDLAYEDLKVHPLKSAARVCQAFRLSPTRAAAWLLGLVRGRLERLWHERRALPGPRPADD
jgi:glycosyltransferase involved in cell wall biosynthesis